MPAKNVNKESVNWHSEEENWKGAAEPREAEKVVFLPRLHTTKRRIL